MSASSTGPPQPPCTDRSCGRSKHPADLRRPRGRAALLAHPPTPLDLAPRGSFGQRAENTRAPATLLPLRPPTPARRWPGPGATHRPSAGATPPQHSPPSPRSTPSPTSTPRPTTSLPFVSTPTPTPPVPAPRPSEDCSAAPAPAGASARPASSSMAPCAPTTPPAANGP